MQSIIMFIVLSIMLLLNQDKAKGCHIIPPKKASTFINNL